jgi:hypothetical protein
MKGSIRSLVPILSAVSHGPYGTFSPILAVSRVPSPPRATGAAAGYRQGRPVHVPTTHRIDTRHSRLTAGLDGPPAVEHRGEDHRMARSSRRHDAARISAFVLDLHDAAALLRGS